MPGSLNDMLGILMFLATTGAIIYMYLKGRANQAVLKGKRDISEELANAKRRSSE